MFLINCSVVNTEWKEAPRKAGKQSSEVSFSLKGVCQNWRTEYPKRIQDKTQRTKSVSPSRGLVEGPFYRIWDTQGLQPQQAKKVVFNSETL